MRGLKHSGERHSPGNRQPHRRSPPWGRRSCRNICHLGRNGRSGAGTCRAHTEAGARPGSSERKQARQSQVRCCRSRRCPARRTGPTPGAGQSGICRSMQRTRGLTLRGMCEGRTAGPGSGSAARSVLPEAAAGQRVGAHIFVYFRMRTTIRSSEIRRVVIRSYNSTVWGSGGIIHQEVASEAEQASSAERITRPGRCSRRRCRASLVLVPRKS